MLLIPSLVMAQTVTAAIPAATPAKHIDLSSPAGKHLVADTIKGLDLCQANLATTTAAYNQCTSTVAPPLQFWQKPGFAIGAPVGAAILTLIVCGIAHCQF
jgi:hypothetical protein